MEQLRGGGSLGGQVRGELLGSFCVQSKLECRHGWSVHNLLWQFVPVRDSSNAERMLTATGFTPLLVILEGVTSKPNAGRGSKEKAVHYFVHADKVTADLGKEHFWKG